MNNHKMNHTTKDDKRRLLLEKRKERLTASQNDFSAAYDMSSTKGFNKRIISLVLVVIFLLSTVGIGVSVLAKAEEKPYSQEDGPIPMRVMVNDELLKNSDTEDYIVFFPSALIENGSIEKGIDFEKVNDDGELLVNSIHHYVDSFLFGDQKENNEINDSYYQSAIVQYPDNSYSFIVKVLINEAGQYVYEKAEEEGIFYTLGSDEYFVLKFRTNSPNEQTVNSESNEENQSAINNDNIATTSEWLSIPGVKESKRIMLPAKASSPTKTGTKLSRVTDIKVYINGAETYLGESYMATLPAGAIADNLSTAVFSKELPNNADYLKATVFNADTGKEVEIIRVGTLSGTNEVYYSLNDDPDTGILLGENDYIILHYGLTYTVSYQVNDSEIITGQGGINVTGGTITGSDTAVYGTDLKVVAKAAKYFAFDSLQYKIGDGDYLFLETADDNNILIGSIIGSDITNDITIKLNTVQQTTYLAIDKGIENGSMAPSPTVLNSATTNEIELVSDQEITSNGKTYEYFLNMVKINGEEVALMPEYRAGSTSNDTVLSDGTKIRIQYLSYSNGQGHYKIIVDDSQSDLSVQAFFRRAGEQRLYLKGLRGIYSTAASKQWVAYEAWIGASTGPTEAGYNYFYTFVEDSSGNYAYPFSTDYYVYTYKADERDFIKLLFGLTISDRFLLLNNSLDKMVSHNIYLYKVKPGYNPYTTRISYLKGNYVDFSNATSTVTGKLNFGETDQMSSKLNHLYFNNNNKAKYHHWSVFNADALFIGSVWWNYPNPDELPLSPMSQRFAYNYSLTWADAFYPKVSSNAYTQGFYIDDLTYYTSSLGTRDSITASASPYYVRENMSINLNAFPYKYQIDYRLNGGSIAFRYDEDKYSTESSTALDSDASFYEINRHVISKDLLTMDDVNDYPNEFNNVENNIIVTPKDAPYRDGYRFVGWKLYSIQNNKFDSTIYGANTPIVITETMCGDDTANKGTVRYKGATPNATDGFANGNTLDDSGMYFTLVAQWEPVSDNEKPIQYTITTYKEVEGAEEGAILNVENQRYYIVDKEITGTGINNKKVVYMNELNPSTNETSYILDEDISTFDTVLTDTNRSFVYYYNLARSVIVKEETGGTFGVKAKKFPISISLVNNSNPGIPVTATYEVEYIITSNEITGQEHAQKGEATFYNGSLISVVSETGNTIPISLKHGEQIRFIGIPEGYILTVHESDESKGDYSLYFDESEEEDEDGSKSLVVSADDRNNIILIRNEYDLVPQEGLLGSRNHYVILYILAGVATISAGAGAVYVYRKKDEFLER